MKRQGLYYHVYNFAFQKIINKYDLKNVNLSDIKFNEKDHKISNSPTLRDEVVHELHVSVRGKNYYVSIVETFRSFLILKDVRGL